MKPFIVVIFHLLPCVVTPKDSFWARKNAVTPTDVWLVLSLYTFCTIACVHMLYVGVQAVLSQLYLPYSV